jgi:hypothetical protein
MIDLHRRGYLRGVERQLSAAQRSKYDVALRRLAMAHALRGVRPVSTDPLKNGRCSPSGFGKGLDAITGLGSGLRSARGCLTVRPVPEMAHRASRGL